MALIPTRATAPRPFMTKSVYPVNLKMCLTRTAVPDKSLTPRDRLLG
jgi:hypothetical protein